MKQENIVSGEPQPVPKYLFPLTSDANDVLHGLQPTLQHGVTFTQDGGYFDGGNSSGLKYLIPFIHIPTFVRGQAYRGIRIDKAFQGLHQEREIV